jgi:hypothetical protein
MATVCCIVDLEFVVNQQSSSFHPRIFSTRGRHQKSIPINFSTNLDHLDYLGRLWISCFSTDARLRTICSYPHYLPQSLLYVLSNTSHRELVNANPVIRCLTRISAAYEWRWPAGPSFSFVDKRRPDTQHTAVLIKMSHLRFYQAVIHPTHTHWLQQEILDANPEVLKAMVTSVTNLNHAS